MGLNYKRDQESFPRCYEFILDVALDVHTFVGSSSRRNRNQAGNLTRPVPGTRGPVSRRLLYQSRDPDSLHEWTAFCGQQKPHWWNCSTRKHFHTTQSHWPVFHQEINLRQQNRLASPLVVQKPLWAFETIPMGEVHHRNTQTFSTLRVSMEFDILKLAVSLKRAVRSRIILWTGHRAQSQGVFFLTPLKFHSVSTNHAACLWRLRLAKSQHTDTPAKVELGSQAEAFRSRSV